MHGRSGKAQKLFTRKQVRSIQTLSVDLSRLRVINYQDLLDNGSFAKQP